MVDVEEIVSPLSENEDMNIVQECPICFMEESTIYKMPCCKNTLCQTCYIDWHFNQKMGTCVFCRNIHLEYEPIDINASRITNSVNFQQMKVLFYLWFIFMTYCFLFVFYLFTKKQLKEN
tara:strand:- start:11992 stop:12351 length:360 start_codon:yes stop_codon:yes gene_type:complete